MPSRDLWSMIRPKAAIKAPRRKRYFCTKCQKYHGKAALKKWASHKSYGRPEQ